VTRLQNFYR